MRRFQVHRVKAIAVIALLGALGLSSCGGKNQVTWIGPVTATVPRLCVGQPAAAGECFDVAGVQLPQGLHAGDCVGVKFYREDGQARLQRMERASIREHAQEFPTG